MIKVVGMGPGNIKYLTMDVVEAVKNSDVVVAFGRISKTAELLRDDVISVNRVDEILNYIYEDKSISILASGDPCFFGILEYLKNKGIIIDEVLPGISSLQYMMAKLKKSWNDAVFVSLHGRDGDFKRIVKNKLSFVLTDSKNTPCNISKRLFNEGVKGKIYVGFNLSYDNEVIFEGRIGDEIGDNTSISVVVIENEMD